MKTLVGTPDPDPFEESYPWWSWSLLMTNSAPAQVLYTTITSTTYINGSW